MPVYPSNYYRPDLTSAFNNNVKRRLDFKDRVGFSQSTRFGGQYMEPSGVSSPYGNTVMDAVAACQHLVAELHDARYILPELGTPVILSTVGVATNLLLKADGALATNAGEITGTATTNVTIDGVGFTTNLRVLYYDTHLPALNGVYVVSGDGGATPWNLDRASDLTYWWQFVKPKVFLATQGTANKGKTYALMTDAWEEGSSFSVALGNTNTAVTGTSIGIAVSDYSANTTSYISPQYTGSEVAGEDSFLAQNSQHKFAYLRNRAKRMAFWVFKLRENYTPSLSSYATNAITGTIGYGNTQYNIGRSTADDLPADSRYPSGINRGF